MSDYVTPERLREQQLAGRAPTIVDVRGAEEYQAGHVPGARHVPLDELPRRLAELPRGRPVVTY